MTSQARTPFVIGIAGGTGAGKTTVTRRLVDSADAARLTVVPLDAYYRDRSGDDERRRAGDDYDHPDAFDWPLLLDHVRALRAGRDVEMPVYDFTRHARERSRRPVKAAPVVVVEGILALHDATLRAQFDLTVFVDADPDVRLIRRLRRDVAERGRTAESVIAQYLATVRPAHLRFVEPTRRYADVVVQNDDRIDRAVELLAARLHAFLDAGRS
jgi:uridine kinase